ncbi:MFS family permease [Alkalihalobacillus xiaoxiensis]|uniref:MFS family permease n=1 Tax=Shouchella xiaoxiensis TaxID=766895 RepID=A0ABS2SNX4_9BACI|nr:MFS transporter [Shouchella xiaoxiensis]MBM7837224.1 MFS family permease [Shouchella xiaoxiensis]
MENRKTEKIEMMPIRSLWKNRAFLLVWGSGTAGTIGLQIYTLVIPLLVYDMSQSALAMSGMRVMEFLPNVLLGMVAGVIVDRLNRKKVMVATIGVQWLAIALLVLLVFSQEIQLWSLFLLGFFFSSAGYFNGNATHSILPQLIQREQLTEANAKMSFTGTLISMIGPGLAGLILAAGSFAGTLVIQFICITIALISMLFLPSPAVHKRASKQSFWADMKEGIQELLQNKTLLTPTIATIFQNFASSMVLGVLIFFAVDRLGSTETEVGFMLSFGAVGGLLGALMVKKLTLTFARGKLYTYTILGNTIGYTLLLVADSWWVIGISLAVRTFAITISNVLYFAIRQEFTPNHMLGRVAGTSSMLMKLALPAGLLAAGLWAEVFEIRILFLFTIIITAAIFLTMFRTTFHKQVT